MVRNILALLGLLSVALVSAVAINAQDWEWENDRPPSLRVSFADLNLSTSDDQKRLDRRIRNAINRVCGRPDLRDLHALQLTYRCRRDARRGTETQVARAIDRARGVAMATAAPARDGTAGEPGHIGSAQ